jgi:hypothetical protein
VKEETLHFGAALLEMFGLTGHWGTP